MKSFYTFSKYVYAYIFFLASFESDSYMYVRISQINLIVQTVYCKGISTVLSVSGAKTLN